MRPCVFATAALVLAMGVQDAIADRGPMERAVAKAMEARAYPQAIANLQRMLESISVPLDDEFVRTQTNAAWQQFLQQYVDASPDALTRLAAVETAFRKANRVGALLAAEAFAKQRDDLLASLATASPSAPLSQQLQQAHLLTTVASSSEVARARFEELSGRAAFGIAAIATPGPYADYVRAQLRYFYGLGDMPSSPIVFNGKYAVTPGNADCTHVIRNIPPLPSSGEPVNVTLTLSKCDATEKLTKVPVEVPYTRKVTENSSRRELQDVAYYEYELDKWCIPRVYMERCGADDWCATGGDDCQVPKRKYRSEWVEIESLVEKTIQEVELVTAEQRTTTFEAQGAFTVQLGTVTAQVPFSLTQQTVEQAYLAPRANKRQQFGDAHARNQTIIANDLAARVRHEAEALAAKRQRTSATLQLVNATGAQRLPALLELAVVERAGTAELLATLTQLTGLPTADIVAALGGERVRAYPAPAALTVAMELPAPDKVGARALEEGEAEILGKGEPGSVGAFNLGLSYLASTDGHRYGAAANLPFSADLWFMRRRRVFGSYDFGLGLGLAGGGDGAGGAALTFEFQTGFSAGLRFGNSKLVASALASHEGVYVWSDNPLPMPGSARASLVWGGGYGVSAQLGRQLKVAAQRIHRNDATYPERWVAELRAGKAMTLYFFLRVEAYRELLAPTTSTNGPTHMWLGIGSSGPVLSRETLAKGVR